MRRSGFVSRRVLRVAALWVLAAPALLFAQTDGVARFSTKGTFEAVKENLVLAIEGRGLVIDRTAHVSDMLERTAADVGAAKTRLYGKAETLEFCSARVSREMMEADPHNAVFCPYTISVYTLPREPGRVYIAYRRPPAEARGMQTVEALLNGIVREAIK